MIAYNLIRQLMCEAAMKDNVHPWQISFENTMQTLNEMLPILSAIDDHASLSELLLECCLKHVVGNRPDRYEPRVAKRRPKPYTFMTKPRDQYKPGKSKGIQRIKCHSDLTPRVPGGMDRPFCQRLRHGHAQVPLADTCGRAALLLEQTGNDQAIRREHRRAHPTKHAAL